MLVFICAAPLLLPPTSHVPVTCRGRSAVMQFGSRAARLQKRTERYDGMIAKLTLDSASLACVNDVRLRAVLRGVAEAGRTPEVRSSFQILYEDMAPIRMAADLIFPRLEATVAEAAASSKPLRVLAAQLGLPQSPMARSAASETSAVPLAELDAARRLFDAIDADGSGEISRDEMVGSGLLGLINPEEPEESAIDAFMREADTNDDGGVSFVEFATYAASCEQLDGEDLADVLAAVGKASQAAPPDAGTARKGKESPGERFDGMLGTFSEWESRLGVKPEVRDDDRLGRVLLGCFAGSKVPEIVEALKVCYVDFKPLRVAGDLIFKIVGEVVDRRSPT